MTKTEIIETLIEMLTEAGYDYHEYNMAATAERVIGAHADWVEDGDIPAGPVTLPDDGTVWEWLDESARHESAPDLLHLAEAA